MIRCCIFDLGGTVVDKYSLSPLLSLANAFGLRRITIPNHIISKDIGKTKIDHIVSLCKEPIVEGQFNRTYGRHISYIDIDNIFADFNKLQVDYMTEHLDIIPQGARIHVILDLITTSSSLFRLLRVFRFFNHCEFIFRKMIIKTIIVI